MLKNHTGRSLWLAGLILTALIAGCSGGSSSVATSTITVVSTSPADAATAVALNSKVIVTFNEAMDGTTINNKNFTVIGKNEAALMGTVSYDSASKTASFTADRHFTASTLYTATVTTNVKSATGLALASNYVWSFTSGTLLDIDSVAPTVNSTNPADGITGFSLNSNVSANFSELLDPATVNSSTFKLSYVDAGVTKLVSGTVSYSNKVATFNPASNLAANTLYTATLTTGITDLAIPANPLAAAKVWSFTTGTDVATGPAPVNLRTAENFVILTKSGITNVPTSAITGNIGVSPMTAAEIHVNCEEMIVGIGIGTIYGVDAGYTGSGDVSCFKGDAVAKALVDNAVLDMQTAYTDAAGRTIPDFTELYAGDISGQTLIPGLYKWGTNVWINSDITLSGGENDVWIFQVSENLLVADGAKVLLSGGAVPKNIFWQVAGDTGVSIGTTAVLEGVVLAEKSVTVATGTAVNGRVLSQAAVTLQQNAVTQPAL